MFSIYLVLSIIELNIKRAFKKCSILITHDKIHLPLLLLLFILIVVAWI